MRVVIYCNDSQLTHFRTRNGYIKPYIEVSLPKSALKGIVIEPTDSTLLNEQSLYHFPQINGYNLVDIHIVSSKIQYQD